MFFDIDTSGHLPRKVQRLIKETSFSFSLFLVQLYNILGIMSVPRGSWRDPVRRSGLDFDIWNHKRSRGHHTYFLTTESSHIYFYYLQTTEARVQSVEKRDMYILRGYD